MPDLPSDLIEANLQDLTYCEGLFNVWRFDADLWWQKENGIKIATCLAGCSMHCRLDRSKLAAMGPDLCPTDLKGQIGAEMVQKFFAINAFRVSAWENGVHMLVPCKEWGRLPEKLEGLEIPPYTRETSNLFKAQLLQAAHVLRQDGL